MEDTGVHMINMVLNSGWETEAGKRNGDLVGDDKHEDLVSDEILDDLVHPGHVSQFTNPTKSPINLWDLQKSYSKTLNDWNL